jgi:hypothetical protein
MTNIAHFKLWLGTAILALAACGGGEANSTNAANDPPANEAAASNEAATAAIAAAPSVAPSATPAGLSADYMVGKWSAIGEDCSGTLEFRKDGTVTTPIGEAKWTVTGDKLSINYNDGSEPITSSVKPLGPDRIEITHSSGTKETEKRC